MDKITTLLQSKFLKFAKAKSYFLIVIFVILSTLNGCSENTQKEIETAIKGEVEKELDNLAESAKEEFSNAVDEVKNDIGKQVDDWLSGIISQAGNLFDSITPKPKQGKLIFMQHGLNDNYKCFEVMVNSLKQDSNYFNLGVFSYGGRPAKDEEHLNNPAYEGYGSYGLHYDDEYFKKILSLFGDDVKDDSEKNPDEYLIQVVNALTDQGINVIVRTEFSTGGEAFEVQLKQLLHMVNKFEGQTADVTFIGHSMGGLASINYGIDYAREHSDKQVNVITISTPYYPNNWAYSAWIDAGYEKFNNNGISQGQRVGLANRDLGNIGKNQYIEGAISLLKSKLKKYNGGNLKIFAIAISMYDKKTEIYWSNKGDGVVDIPSQQAQNWDNLVNRNSKIIFGHTDEPNKGHYMPHNDLQDTEHKYHHVNTPKRTEVLDEVKKLLK